MVAYAPAPINPGSRAYIHHLTIDSDVESLIDEMWGLDVNDIEDDDDDACNRHEVEDESGLEEDELLEDDHDHDLQRNF